MKLIKATILGLVLLALTACGSKPATMPKAQDVAIVAINTVDAALAIEIATSTADAGANAMFEKEVALLQAAADVVKSGASICSVLPGLELVATDLSCGHCSAPIAAAKEAFKCQ